MNVVLKVLIWVCGMIFIVALFNSLIRPKKDELFRNIKEGVKKVGQHRPAYLKGWFGRKDLARYGVGLPQSKEGVFIIFCLIVTILVFTFIVVNYL